MPNSKTFFVIVGSKFYQILNKTSQICPRLLKLCQSGEISTIWPHCTHSLCRQLIRKFRLGDPFRLDHNEKSIFYFSIERNHSNFGFLLQVLQNVNRNIFTVSVLKKNNYSWSESFFRNCNVTSHKKQPFNTNISFWSKNFKLDF